jgi:hypothetical protein
MAMLGISQDNLAESSRTETLYIRMLQKHPRFQGTDAETLRPHVRRALAGVSKPLEYGRPRTAALKSVARDVRSSMSRSDVRFAAHHTSRSRRRPANVMAMTSRRRRRSLRMSRDRRRMNWVEFLRHPEERILRRFKLARRWKAWTDKVLGRRGKRARGFRKAAVAK